MSIIVLLLGALTVGSIAYAVVTVLRMTLSWLKNYIKKKMEDNPPGITDEAVISVQDILDQAPSMKLDAFGEDIQEDDFLVMGIKEDGGLSDDMDIIRADKVDDEVKAVMKKNGGAVKITI